MFLGSDISRRKKASCGFFRKSSMFIGGLDCGMDFSIPRQESCQVSEKSRSRIEGRFVILRPQKVTNLFVNLSNFSSNFRQSVFLTYRIEYEPLRFRLDLCHAPPFAENRRSSKWLCHVFLRRTSPSGVHGTISSEIIKGNLRQNGEFSWMSFWVICVGMAKLAG